MKKETQKIMFSKSTKETDEWETPKDLFDKLDAEFHFTLDAAASDKNHLCSKYYTEETNSLIQDWTGEVAFCNPPYSSELQREFVKKAYEEARKPGTTCVLLLPARTDTKLFHEYCMKAAEIRFIKGRVKFGLPPGSTAKQNSAPFPSMIVVFSWIGGKNPKVSTYELPKRIKNVRKTSKRKA